MSSNLDDDPWVGTATTAKRRSIPKAVWWALGGCGLATVLGGVVLGFFLVRIAEGPETHAVAGDEVSPSTIAWLVAKGLIEPGEQLVTFYSAGVFDAESEGSFCTDRRVVDYRDEPEWTVRSVAYTELARVERRSPNILEQEIELLLTPRDGEPFAFIVPLNGPGEPPFEFVDPSDGPDLPPFETALRAAWRAADPARAFRSEGLWLGEGELSSELRAEFVTKGVFAEGEVVLAVFGWEGTPLEQWGTACTNERLLRYSFVEGGNESPWSVRVRDIASIELRPEDPDEEEPGIVVVMDDGEEFLLTGDGALLALFEPVLARAREAARK